MHVIRNFMTNGHTSQTTSSFDRRLLAGPLNLRSAEIALAGWVGCTEGGLEGGVVGDDGGESLSYAALAGEDHGVEGREGGL